MLKNYFQKRWIKFLAGHLFNTITEDDILKVLPGNVLMYRGKKMEKEWVSQLREKAMIFSNSVLWEMLSNEVKYLSNLRMYEKGKTDDDLLAGKMALYVLEVLDKKLKELSSLK